MTAAAARRSDPHPGNMVPMETSRLPYVGALDGLRGAAVLAVVLFHAGRLTGGYLGVDLFFVLSGFLITSLLLREHSARGRIALATFWARRARRLLPALGLMLLGVAAFAATVASPREVETLRGDVLGTLAYVANWRAIFTGNDYWALFRSPSALEHTWSLAIEEQFYVIWPLVVVGLARAGRTRLSRRVLGLSLVGAATSWVILQLVFDATDTARAYYGTDTRVGSILIGAALAAASQLHPGPLGAKSRAALSVAGWAGTATLAVAWAALPGDDPMLYRFGFLACAVSAAAVLAVVVRIPDHPLGRAFSVPPLRALGWISYGVYLWHWPVDVFANSERVGLTGWPLIVVQFAITLTIAIASYRWIEQPIRHGWGAPRIWRVATPVLAATLVGVTLIATAGHATNPRPALDPTVAIAATSREKLVLQAFRLDQSAGRSTPRILLGGDSLAFALGSGARNGPTSPFAVANIAMIGCGLTPGVPVGPKFFSPPEICQQWPAVWRRATPIFKPEALVLLTGTWDIWPRRIGGRSVSMYSSELSAEVDRSLEQARKVASAADVPLILLTMPCLHPTEAERALVADGLEDPRRAEWLNAEFARFARQHPDTHVVDLHAWACDQPTSTFDDGVHFSAAGAARAWRWLTPHIQAITAAHAGTG